MHIANPIEVDATNEDKETALMYVVRQGNVAMAEMLLKAGSNLQAFDNNGDNVIKWACFGQDATIGMWSAKDNGPVHNCVTGT